LSNRGLLYRENLTAYSIQFLHCLLLLFLVERLAMPAIHIFQERDAFSLDGLGNDDRWCPFANKLFRLRVCIINLIIVMPINDNSSPTESLGTLSIGLSVPAKLGL